MEITQTLWKHFIRDYNLPIQNTDINYKDYYLNLYDDLFDTKHKYKVFCDALAQFKDEADYNCYRHKIAETLSDLMRLNTTTNAKADDNVSQYVHRDIYEGANCTKGLCINESKLYKPDNHNKYYLSIEISQPQYQGIRYWMNTVTDNHIFTSETFEKFMGKITPIEHFYISPGFMRFMSDYHILGRMCHCGILINKICMYLMNYYKIEESAITAFVTDSLCREFDSDTYKIIVGTDNYYTDDKCQQIVEDIKRELDINVTVDSFKLLYVGNDSYVEEHSDSSTHKVGFKCTNSVLPQLYKAYYNQPLTDEDLLVEVDGSIAKFETPLKWKNI